MNWQLVLQIAVTVGGIIAGYSVLSTKVDEHTSQISALNIHVGATESKISELSGLKESINRAADKAEEADKLSYTLLQDRLTKGE